MTREHQRETRDLQSSEKVNSDSPASPNTTTKTSPAPVPTSTRVYILAERTTLIPMVLPACAPLERVVAATAAAVATRLAPGTLDDSAVYELAWIDGAAISDKAHGTLENSGVRDGDILQLLPALEPIRYVPRNENVASALATYLRTRVNPVTATIAHAVAIGTIITAILVCTGLLWRARLDPACPVALAATALGVLAALGWAATAITHVRWPQFGWVRDGFAATSVAVSAAALAAVPPKLGPANVFAGACALSAGAIVVISLRKRYWAAGTAVACIATLAAAAAGVELYSSLSGFQIGVAGLVCALVLITAAPRLALTLARIPRQPFRSIRNRDMFDHASGQPHDTVSPVIDDVPDPSLMSAQAVASAAERARSVLIGTCTAVAVIEVVSAWLAITPHQHRPVLSTLLVIAVAVELIGRARRFNDAVQATLLVTASAAALVIIGAKYGWTTPGGDLSSVLTFCGWALLPATGIFLMGTALWQHLFSPNTRKAVEWLGYALIVVIPVLAAWALGIFGYLRTQGVHW